MKSKIFMEQSNCCIICIFSCHLEAAIVI